MTVEELEKAVSKLSPEDRVRFRAWYEQFDADEWDRQIEADIKSGKFDKLVEASLADYRAGRFSEI